MAGLAIAIERQGQRLVEKGYGWADLENDVPVTPETVFRIGSITKQFTAAIIMQLVEEGALGLDDPIDRFLPDYPAHGARITVRHLLMHSSGIFEYTHVEDFWFEWAPRPLDKERMLELFQDRPLRFQPGTESSYNNSGYLLLGLIIESATGEAYGQVLERRIFTPLSMTSTGVCDARSIVRRRAQGYEKDSGRLVNDPPDWTYAGAAGSLCSTVGDLLIWSEALHGGQILSPESYQTMTTPALLPDGSVAEWSYGIDLTPFDGEPTISFSGQSSGFYTWLAYYPEHGVHATVLGNTRTDRVVDVGLEVGRWLVADR
jgi:CubicO group peptidase (beta-lactamase class C family)